MEKYPYLMIRSRFGRLPVERGESLTQALESQRNSSVTLRKLGVSIEFPTYWDDTLEQLLVADLISRT